MLTVLLAQKDGEFNDGVNLHTVTMSHPDIIEDSYTISETAAKAMHAYGLRAIDFTLRDDSTYLIRMGQRVLMAFVDHSTLPVKGQAIRDDGLVIAARRFDKLWAAIDSHVGETQHISPHFDRCEYVDADPEHLQKRVRPATLKKMERTGSRVVDIQVWQDETDTIVVLTISHVLKRTNAS
ncbi:hypothetical protein N5V81_14060 [Escherichia coli]|nr:hypothetical protein [Escherichia coli]